MSTELQARLQAALGTTHTIERELGGGGMSHVFVAEETALRRRVVVKVLPPDAAGGVSVERFQREILVAARLQHPLIVPVIGTGGNSDLLYFTMPFVEGESLRARIAREGALPIPDVLRILRDVSAALAAAHVQGVVHRDVKPDNILLSGGFAMVTDFGVAKALERARAPGSIGGTEGTNARIPALETLTAFGTFLGTPPYMSPEQAAGDGRVDQRSDLYSLGATAYEMLTGSPPFEGASVQAVIAAHLTRLPEPPTRRRASVPSDLEALVMRLLEKDPADRSQSAVDVQRAVETMLVAPTTSLPTLPRHTPATTRGRALPKGVLIVAVAAMVLGAVTIARWRGGLTREGVRGGPAATEAEGESSGFRSIAVLPFVNASADAGNEYFSDGVSEELIDALAKVGGVRVASRSSSFAFKGKNLAARTIAESLGVQAMIEGSVRSAGGRLRITAQLTRASDGSALWSEKYDRESRDVFAVQEELARAILGAVRDRLSGRPVAVVGSSPLVRHGTADPQAYELYLRGRYFWNQRSREGFVRAAEYFGQAIARDSGNARAWSGLADSQCILANFGYRPASEVCPKSEVAARHAIALDSTLAEAHASLGFVQFFYRWDLVAAKRELERALALDSTYANAHLWLSQLAWARGDTAQMLARMREALAIEALSPIMNSRYVTMLWRAGRREEAWRQLQRTLELDSTFADARHYRGLLLLDEGKTDEGVREMERFLSADWVAYAYARAKRPADARRLLARITARRERGEYISPLRVAYAYAELGERDEAFRWLERSYETREPDMLFLATDPYSVPLRRDPRFAALVERVRLGS